MSHLPFLSILILMPFLGVLSIISIKQSQIQQNAPRVALLTSGINLFISIFLWFKFDPFIDGYQFVEKAQWLAAINSYYYVGIDGLSLILITLTTFLIFITLLSSKPQKRTKEFLCAFLMLESMLVGVFCALDLILFYFFFEAVLIPMFIIIGIWGGHQRIFVSLKFFFFMATGSILMLTAFAGLYFETGITSIPSLQLGYILPFTQQAVLWWALFIAFAVNIPMWPFHTWLIDTHVEAPTSGSMILSGLMVKVGCYGLLRLNFSLFPDASSYFAPIVYVLSCFSILYASLAALVQENIKKAIAYASFASIAFVPLGIFTFNSQGIVGSMIHMVSHGLIVAALFFCIGILHERFHSYDISSFGGLVDKLPRFSTLLLIFILALIGVPGLGGFIGELLVIIGIFRVSMLSTFAIGLGIILITSCGLLIYRRLIFDKLNKAAIGMKNFVDLKPLEIGVLIAFVVPLLWIGLYPHRLFTIVNPHVVYLVEKYRKSRSFKYDISKDIADFFGRRKP